MKREVKLYVEVEFSAQGYDTHTHAHLTSPKGRHRPKDSPQLTTWY